MYIIMIKIKLNILLKHVVRIRNYILFQFKHIGFKDFKSKLWQRYTPHTEQSIEGGGGYNDAIVWF